MTTEILRLTEAGLQVDSAPLLPPIFSRDQSTAERVLDFFTANIRNPNTRKAYARGHFLSHPWTEERPQVKRQAGKRLFWRP